MIRPETAETFTHRFMLSHIADAMAEDAKQWNTIVCADTTGQTFFWEGQTPDEVQMVKEFLVRRGLATWAVRRS